MSEQANKDNKIMLWNGKDLTGWIIVPEEAISQQTWSVKEGVLYSEGAPNGYIRTDNEYSDYHLHVEWRWPENAAQGRRRNSGVFVHQNGTDQVWPKVIECQLQSGSAGSFVLINGTGMTVDGENKQNPNQQFVIINRKQDSTENPAGQWNSYDIYCQADTIRCFVNDVFQNEGTSVIPSSGHICLQSEGSPIEFRNIYIEPVNE